MAELIIDSNKTFYTTVTVRESDEYSKAAYIVLNRHNIPARHPERPDEIRGVSEVFMTPSQLDLLGRFLIRQAQEIATMQEHRTANKAG